MRKFIFSSAAAVFALVAGATTAAETPLIGIVNFATAVTESKAGKKEQENMEGMRKQMASLMEDTEKELREIATKFEDTEYLDSLSPKAEEDLKIKYQSLQEDLNRYQSQFYQVLNHANYQMIQKMTSTIAKAAERIAAEKKLDYVLNKEVCFYIRPDFDITSQVVSEMDKAFEIEAKKTAEAETSNVLDEMVTEKAG